MNLYKIEYLKYMICINNIYINQVKLYILVRVQLFVVKTCFYQAKIAKSGKNLSLPC